MTDDAKPDTDKVRSKTMHPALRERLQRPIYRRMTLPTGGGVIITGVGPQTPRSAPEQTATKPGPTAASDT